MIGQTLGHYRIVEKIGAGGMGVVYRARDARLERDVALKVLPQGILADEPARKRFRKEALTLSQLNHPHIATVHDFDTQAGVDFLVMEYVAGASLADKLSGGALPEREVAALGAQIATALEEAHEHGVVHRDLKSGNILVTPKGQAKVLDFGLAKLLRPATGAGLTQSVTETPGIAGTLPYMAPEQLRGEPADARTDIFALGAVLYEMATARRPFPEDLAPRLIDAILHQAPTPPSALNRRISPALESIILKALDKDPGRRYQSATDLRVDLERISAPVPVVAAPRALAPFWRGSLAAAAATSLLLAVLLGLNVGGLRERLFTATTQARIGSLAVLPLANLSGDPEQEYFADGMTEALITELSRIGALKVISRTSAMQYKGARKTLPQIAKELNVDAVVEGSVLRSGHRVRITAQLIHAATDRHLWAENYERDLQDILALQSEVARTIAREIRVQLTPQEQLRLARTRPVNAEAHEAYLQGRYLWNQRSQLAVMKSIEYFEQAIAKDPTNATSYAGLADAYAILGNLNFLAPKEAYPKARAAALKALELDDSLGEAHTSLALVRYRFDWEWLEAETAFKRALELNPGYATGHQFYGIYLIAVGRLGEAQEEIEHALALDPLSLIINALQGWPLYYARQYDQAIPRYLKAAELAPDFFLVHWYLGLAYQQKGMRELAIRHFQKAVALAQFEGHGFTLGSLGRAYAEAGKRSAALKVLEELKSRSSQQYVAPSAVAEVYLGLGEKDQALEWLRRAVEERASQLVYMKVDPAYDPLRSDPRFQDLLRRMNFPP